MLAGSAEAESKRGLGFEARKRPAVGAEGAEGGMGPAMGAKAEAELRGPLAEVARTSGAGTAAARRRVPRGALGKGGMAPTAASAPCARADTVGECQAVRTGIEQVETERQGEGGKAETSAPFQEYGVTGAEA